MAAERRHHMYVCVCVCVCVCLCVYVCAGERRSTHECRSRPSRFARQVWVSFFFKRTKNKTCQGVSIYSHKKTKRRLDLGSLLMMSESCPPWLNLVSYEKCSKKGGKPAAQIDGVDLIDESYTLRLNNIQYKSIRTTKKEKRNPNLPSKS